MGIAAYNRGTAVICRQIDAEQQSHWARVLSDLNDSVTGTERLFAPAVARFGSDGHVYLMNKPQDGWASFGYQYRSLREIGREWAVQFTGWGQDAHSLYVNVEPKP